MKDLSPIQTNNTQYNVKSFGAKGDNATNDGPAIQAALDAAWTAGGGWVVIPKGIYRVYSSAASSSPLKIRSNIRLTCLPGAEIHRYHNAGAASLVWSGDWTQGMAGFGGHKNILIEGGIWDMRNSASTVTLASDTFTATNTTAPHTLGVMTTGQTWIDETSRDDGTSTSGNLGVTSNTAYNPAASTAISTVKVWPDGTTSVTIPTVGSTGYAGLVFRMDNSNNGWQYVRDNATSGNARLSYWLNGVETVITPNTTRAVVATETLTVVRFGSRILAYVVTAAGVATLTHDTTDVAGFTAYRKAGIIITDTTSRLDGFSSSASIWADNFNRTSAVSLGTASSNYAWTARSGTLGTTGGATAYAPGAGTNISTVDVTSECNPTVTVTTTGTASAGLVFRYIDTSNYWYFIRNSSTGQSELGKVVAGSTTVITASTPTTVSAGGVLSVQVIGYEISAFVGAVQTHGVNNDSANYAGTKAGIIINDTTTRLDSFDTPAAWGQSSGAAFSFSHNTNVTWRDMTVLDTSQNSHSIDLQGVTDCLIDNVRFLGTVGGQSRGAVQIDAAINDGLPPIEAASTSNLLIRGCTVSQSYAAGTNAYARAFESHAGKVGTWYKNIRIVDNYIDVIERGIKAYNWLGGVIANNNFVAGWGLEYTTISTGNTTDTTSRGGTQTSASQAVYGITITGNVIDATGSTASGGHAAIRVFGESTGRLLYANVTGNSIKGTPANGLAMEYVDRGTVSGNVVANPSGIGMLISNCTDTVVSGNSVFTTGGLGIEILAGNNNTLAANRIDTTSDRGIYVASSSTDNTITGNTLKSCNTTGGASTGAMAISGSANTGTVVNGNVIIKGSSTATVGLRFEGSTSTNSCVTFNTFRGWGATVALNMVLSGSPNTGAGDSGALANVNTYNAS